MYSFYRKNGSTDKFIIKELVSCGLTGPFHTSPFEEVMTSFHMTAVKKPDSRREVFDASLYMITPQEPNYSVKILVEVSSERKIRF